MRNDQDGRQFHAFDSSRDLCCGLIVPLVTVGQLPLSRGVFLRIVAETGSSPVWDHISWVPWEAAVFPIA
jgi:hypothetical protein